MERQENLMIAPFVLRETEAHSGEGTYLILTNGASIPVSRQHKDKLLERFGWV